MHKWFKILMVVFAITISNMALAQDVDATDKEGIMRAAGKIYVVLAIASTILIGLILYVVRLDRKISKLERGDL
ncbi:MAG TPA: hypothetical protein VF622_06670 [Segetibacter sp.]|jgi:hypothetical protein